MNFHSTYLHDLLAQPYRLTNNHLHIAQFYEDDTFLCNSVSQFVSTGLQSGEGVIIIATQSHREALEHSLNVSGISVVNFKNKGQLTILDTQETLSLFMDGDLPDKKLFFNCIGGLIDKVASSYSPIRAYGEMVNVLWSNGNFEGTIALEKLWNDLAMGRSFSLLCGYTMDNFDSESHNTAFNDICHAHSRIVPAEGFTLLQDNDAQLRLIAQLQQKALALETEISERKRLESIKDEFLGTVSHELRTPLGIVKAALDCLDDGLDGALNDDQSQTVKLAKKNIDRLARLVEDLLSLSSLESGKIQIKRVAVDLGHVLRNTLESFSAKMGMKVSLIFDAPKNLPFLKVDVDWITQVIYNLLDNAFRHAQKQVTLSAAFVSDKKGAPHIQVTVTDDGKGIQAKAIKKLFNKFEQINRPSGGEGYRGTGLGLAICKKIIALHGGKIWVDSHPGQGAQFHFRLPLNDTSVV